MLTPEELEKKRQALDEKRRLKREERRKRRLFYLLCVLIGVLLLAATAYWSYSHRSGTPNVAAVSQDNPNMVNILFMGADSGLTDGTRTDTMILVSVDKSTGDVGALAIPRDTRVHIPGHEGYDRINAAHAYGGPMLALRTVENLLDVKVDYYVRVGYDGFESIIDTLGGVVIDVEKRMVYEDDAQNLKIDLKPGVQLLSGEQALHYVRFRADGLGDVALIDPAAHTYSGRVERQLKFVKSLLNQAFSARALVSAPKLVTQLRASVTSNIPADDALRLILLAKDIKTQNIKTSILPGVGQMVGGASYWVVDEPLAREVVNKLIAHRHGMVRVEVLNGNGSSGIAARVADVLREKGFEVVAVGNADHFSYRETEVIPRRGDMALATQVAKAIGKQEVGVQPEADEPIVATDADVTVILGRDLQI